MELMSSLQPDRMEKRRMREVEETMVPKDNTLWAFGWGHTAINPAKRVPESRNSEWGWHQNPLSHFPLPLTQGSEQLHATVFAFKKDCVVVSVVGSAHPDQHDFHCSWRVGDRQHQAKLRICL